MLFANTITTLKITNMYNEVLCKNRKTQGNISGRVIIVGHECIYLRNINITMIKDQVGFVDILF